MKFRRFLTRHFRGFRLRSVHSLPGVRQAVLFMGDTTLVPYRGPLDQHVLIMVREGTVSFDRNGEREEAHERGALLVSRGEAGRLTFLTSPDTHGLTAEIYTFDERSIAKILRNQIELEFREPAVTSSVHTVFAFRRFESLLPTDSIMPMDLFRAAVSQLAEWDLPGLPEFFQNAYYQPRWDLCIFLERFVLDSEGAKKAAANYKGGMASLRHDCLLYLGAMPEAVLTRRRCGLAAAWLRCGHSIEAVAKALGYPSQWQFECVFSRVTKKRCREVQELAPLAEAEPEELLGVLQPFWWNTKRLTEGPIPQARMFGSDMMSPELEAIFLADYPQHRLAIEEQRLERIAFTEDLKNQATDFFAMKSTGTDVLIPILKPGAGCGAVAA